MTLTEQQMLDGMAYADGELDEQDTERVRALVEENADAKELLASLHAIGDGVRSAVGAPPSVDVADDVMRKITPNDLDRARIRRTNRVRMGVVAASLVALAAAVTLYVRHNSGNHEASNPTTVPSDSNALASLHTTGVEVDSVDTPSSVSVFYVPADNPDPAAKSPNTVVVWVDDPEVAP